MTYQAGHVHFVKHLSWGRTNCQCFYVVFKKMFVYYGLRMGSAGGIRVEKTYFTGTYTVFLMNSNVENDGTQPTTKTLQLKKRRNGGGSME